MSDRDKTLWQAVRRGLLLIAAHLESDSTPFYVEVRRGLLLIARAIERELGVAKP